MKKNDIDKIMGSLEGIKRVNPRQEFRIRLQNATLNRLNNKRKMSKLSLLMIAASFAVLLMSNIAIYNMASSSDSSTYSSLELDYSYNLIPTKSLIDE